jgi:hypothetical protein
VVVAGRDADRLAAAWPTLERWVARLDAPDDLARAAAGAAVVVNAAGPFLDTAVPLAVAAIDVGAHYVDLAAEQAAVQQVHALHDRADAARVAVVPALAFFGGLADLLVTRALAGSTRADEVDEVAVAVWLDRWWPTAGTRETGRRNTVPRLVVHGGRLEPIDAVQDARADWSFPEPVGPQPVTPLPFSEVPAIARHLTVGELRSYLASAPLADLRDPATPPPPADADGRSPQRFVVEVEVVVDGVRRRLAVAGRDIYAASAPLVVGGVQRLLAGVVGRTGALAPAEVFAGALDEAIASVAEQFVSPTT